MLRVLYFVHDLSDPAVRRRVMMLRAGGAKVVLAGFRRAADVAPDIVALSPIDLGRTKDGKFGQRLAAIASAAAMLGSRLRHVAKPDIIIGRNLEMLALASRARGLFGVDIPIVYECLDIHRLLLGQNGVSWAMRGAERVLGRNAALLLTSSPAFIRDYFKSFGQTRAPIALLHNKVLELAEKPEPFNVHLTAPEKNGAWTIGWFGALRCRKSLDLLASFTRRMEGRFEVVLRGRPAYSQFDDFDRRIAAEPFMRFEGPYRNPEDLASIYGAVHFSWAIDFFEEGLNSRWLLPNRLFEGCRYGAVPIAAAETETGRFLGERHLGIVLDDVSDGALVDHLGGMTCEAFATARNRIVMQDQTMWVCDLRECRALVERLASLSPDPTREMFLQAV